MIPVRIIPVLLLQGRRLVKGIRYKDYKYVGDPMNAVRIFNTKKVDELVLIDIAATTERRGPDIAFIQQVADESYMPFAFGGGIRTVEDAQSVLQAGAEKVSICTAALERPALIREAGARFGSQSIIVSIDVRRGLLGRPVVYARCGALKTGLAPVDWARRAEELGAGEIMVNAIDRDGTGKGYDIDLVRSIADAVRIPVIAAGGAGSYDDLDAVAKQGRAAAAAAGSLFVFHGPHRSVLINYPERRDMEAAQP